MTDTRRRTRVGGHFKGKLLIREQAVPISTENLSLKGMLCILEQEITELDAGLNCVVHIHLSEDIMLKINSTVVRQTKEGVALDFDSMDEDSYVHLRNIVRFSAKDPDAIDEEQVLKPFVTPKNE